jgi:integrase/recombinase XerD
MAALHPHLLRHTMATHAVNAGMPIQEVSALLGHESVETTMIYAHTSGTALQQDYFRCVG